MAKTDTAAREARIGVVGFDGCSSWIAAGLLELFAIANSAQSMVGRARTRAEHCASFRAEVIAKSRRPVRASQDVRLGVAPLRKHYDAVIVPPIWCRGREELVQQADCLRMQDAFLQDAASRCTVLAAACTGVVLVAQAGLLENFKATTCWWLLPWFAERFPAVELAGDRLVVRDGPRWTAGAGTAYIHLGLAFVRQLAGDRVAAMTARLLLVENRRGSQSPFMGPLAATFWQEAQSPVGRMLRHLDRCIATEASIAAVAAQLGVTERTLARRVQAAVGMSPLAYLQSQRVAHAKELLAKSSLPFEQIVGRCGYQDVASFRKLFARLVGMTPREYRAKFRD